MWGHACEGYEAMTKAAGPMRVEQYKPRMYQHNYVRARFVCPACSRRYGEPEAHGYIDIKRCEKCPTFGVKDRE